MFFTIPIAKYDVRVDDEKQIVIENAHDPIIDIKTFVYAKEQLALRSKSNYRGEKKYATDWGTLRKEGALVISALRQVQAVKTRPKAKYHL